MSVKRSVRFDHLIGVYAVGSGDWSWIEEYDHLIDQPDTQKLLARIREEGIREPILLGSDGRVWDGHHRIVIAMHLGLDSVPVEFAGAVAEEPEWESWTFWGSQTEGGAIVREFRGERYASHRREVKAGPWVPVEQGDDQTTNHEIRRQD